MATYSIKKKKLPRGGFGCRLISVISDEVCNKRLQGINILNLQTSL
jgi:hypothetical protein